MFGVLQLRGLSHFGVEASIQAIFGVLDTWLLRVLVRTSVGVHFGSEGENWGFSLGRARV